MGKSQAHEQFESPNSFITMSTTEYSITVLPGDGIGPEVIEQAVRILEHISNKSSTFKLHIESHDFGGAAIDSSGEPLPESTRVACKKADAILLGAVGGPKWGVGKVRPEQGLLAIRKELDLYANVRPALFPSESLLEHSPLRPEIAKGTEFIVIRELVKGLYYGDRKEADLSTPDAKGEAYDMMVYDKADVQRITRLAAYLAMQSSPPTKIHSIDKANVLATSRLWRHVVTETIEKEFRDKGVEVDHHLVDSAAMVMVSNPRKLNGIVLTKICLVISSQTNRRSFLDRSVYCPVHRSRNYLRAISHARDCTSRFTARPLILRDKALPTPLALSCQLHCFFDGPWAKSMKRRPLNGPCAGRLIRQILADLACVRVILVAKPRRRTWVTRS